MEKQGWKKRAITKSTGKKSYIKAMVGESGLDNDKYWIKPKKLSIDSMQKIRELVDTQKEEVKVTEETIGLFSIVYHNGVADHNLDYYEEEDGKEVVKKCDWNDDLFVELKEFSDILTEIFHIVVGFNSPLAEEKSKK